jgi:hypothetical protein
MKLYSATISFPIVVLAESLEDAACLADESAQDELENALDRAARGVDEPVIRDVKRITKKNIVELPESWQYGIPYGCEDDRTVAQIVEGKKANNV